MRLLSGVDRGENSESDDDRVVRVARRRLPSCRWRGVLRIIVFVRRAMLSVSELKGD